MQIISTLGPASFNDEFLAACVDSGQLYFRLNSSFMSSEEIAEHIRFVTRKLPGIPIMWYLDVKGRKTRIGRLSDPLILKESEQIPLAPSSNPVKNSIPITDRNLFHKLRYGDEVLLQDGKIRLKITRIESDLIFTNVLQGGTLRSGAGIQLKNNDISEGNHVEWSEGILEQAKSLGIQNLALSYVRRTADIKKLKKSCSNISYKPNIISKIEHPDALDSFESICGNSDAIWFCRGDLGTHIELREMGHWQDKIVAYCKELKRPVSIAGQVFQHFTENPYPTRSEIVHFYHLQKQGVESVILSDETAIGKYSCKAIRQITSLIV